MKIAVFASAMMKDLLIQTLFKSVLLILRRKPHAQTSSRNLEWQGQIITFYSEISMTLERTPHLHCKHAIHSSQ